jgi:Zn-dependent oligopeptidase
MQYLRNDAVGSAIDDVSSLRTSFEQRLLQSNDTFAALLNITRSGMLTRQEEMRVVRGLIQGMQAAGAGQPSNRLARLNDIERRLTVLNNKYMDNVQLSQEVRSPAM